MKTILFVCTGNTCRSPMAEALMNRLLATRGVTGVRAESAGLAAADGECASENAVLAAAELDCDLSSHRARRVTAERIENSDAVYCMSPSHRAALTRAFPQAAHKILVLGGGIPDPFGGDLAVYRAARDRILAALRELPVPGAAL